MKRNSVDGAGGNNATLTLNMIIWERNFDYQDNGHTSAAIGMVGMQDFPKEPDLVLVSGLAISAAARRHHLGSAGQQCRHRGSFGARLHRNLPKDSKRSHRQQPRTRWIIDDQEIVVR